MAVFGGDKVYSLSVLFFTFSTFLDVAISTHHDPPTSQMKRSRAVGVVLVFATQSLASANVLWAIEERDAQASHISIDCSFCFLSFTRECEILFVLFDMFFSSRLVWWTTSLYRWGFVFFSSLLSVLVSLSVCTWLVVCVR